MGLGYFMNDPQQGKQIKIEIVDRRPKDKPYGELMMPLMGEVAAGADARPRLGCGSPAGPGITPPARRERRQSPMSRGSRHLATMRSVRRRIRCRRSTCPRLQPGLHPSHLVPVRASALPDPGPPPVGTGEPAGTFPSIPGMNMTDVGPDHNDPFPNRSFADVIASVEEAPTGRFMIGVGANSFQGLMGNIQIYEKNFDIFNIPALLQRHRQRPGVSRRRPVTSAQPPGGKP